MNVKKSFTYYGPGGVLATGAELILKDSAGIASDVVMEELGNGVYTAEVPAGVWWEVHDNAPPPGVDTGYRLDSGVGLSREPAIPTDVPTKVWTGAKVWTYLTKGMIQGLTASLTSEEDARVKGDSDEAKARVNADNALAERIQRIEGGTKAVGTLTCSSSPITLRKTVMYPASDAGYGWSHPIGDVASDGKWMDLSELLLNGASPPDEDLFAILEVDGVGVRSPISSSLVPGAITRFGVEVIFSTMPTVGGAVCTSLCDFQFAIARIGIDGTIGAYSEFVTPSIEWHLRKAPDDPASPGIYRANCSLPTPFEIAAPGGVFSIKVQAKVKTSGAAVNLGSWHHANVDITLFPKVA